MFDVLLKNNKSFSCDNNLTIFEGAKKAGVILEHSCLKGRCRSCIVKVISGKTKNLEEENILTDIEKKENFVLSCNAIPLSNLKLNVEEIEDFNQNFLIHHQNNMKGLDFLERKHLYLIKKVSKKFFS